MPASSAAVPQCVGGYDGRRGFGGSGNRGRLMLTATRTPVMPYALRPKKEPWRHPRPADRDAGHHAFIDPWLPLCLRCPLFDCILPEGGAGGYRAEKRRAE